MAASRLTDSQKSELVQRYRQGESSAELAAAYGCSPNTVSRTVKAALDPAEYEQLKQQRSQRVQTIQPDPEPDLGSGPDRAVAAGPDDTSPDDTGLNDTSPDDAREDSSILAIDDADDFAGDDADSDDEAEGDDDIFTPIAVLPLAINHEPVAVQPLAAAEFPESLYMLVDKTVELQARPLREFTELGQLPPHEEELQALQLFANPRQAKRHCGRTQRVIKMPDPAVFVRRASYLQVKGITRLVVEGNLYALPGC
jgi:CENP-B N-terminal DNA-binding domain